MTASEVVGRGRRRGVLHPWRGREYRVDMMPEVRLEIVVHGEEVEDVIQAIASTARAGKIGDGKTLDAGAIDLYLLTVHC